MESPFDAFCSKCRKDISSGSEVVHIPASGVVHMDCGRAMRP
jgi:hypothetical protein